MTTESQEEFTVRKLAVVAILILTFMAGAIGFAQAQTPTPQEVEETPISAGIPGASLELIAADASNTGVVGMTLYRITLEPGTSVPAHEHGGAVTWYVDSGTLALTVTSGEVWVRCAADCVSGGTLDASGFVLVPLDEQVTLEAGDWIIQHDTAVHAYSNAGEDNVVINASTMYLNVGRGCNGGCL